MNQLKLTQFCVSDSTNRNPVNITGHGAFSESNQVNDIVGLIVHSAFLTPYHSWKISHRKHHSNTGSCENDEAFVPFTEDQIKSNPFHIVSDSPLFVVLKAIFYLLLGWMPAYLGCIRMQFL